MAHAQWDTTQSLNGCMHFPISPTTTPPHTPSNHTNKVEWKKVWCHNNHGFLLKTEPFGTFLTKSYPKKITVSELNLGFPKSDSSTLGAGKK
jgi:hypothetical protein